MEAVYKYLWSEVDGLELDTEFVDGTSGIGQSLLNNQAEITRSDVVMLVNPGQFDVVGIVKKGGTPVYSPGIATRSDSDIEELADLERERMAFADRLSTSRSPYPSHTLDQTGLDTGEAPDGDLADCEGEHKITSPD